MYFEISCTMFDRYIHKSYIRYSIDPIPIWHCTFRFFSRKFSFLSLYTINLWDVSRVLRFTMFVMSYENLLLLFLISYVWEVLRVAYFMSCTIIHTTNYYIGTIKFVANYLWMYFIVHNYMGCLPLSTFNIYIIIWK